MKRGPCSLLIARGAVAGSPSSRSHRGVGCGLMTLRRMLLVAAMRRGAEAEAHGSGRWKGSGSGEGDDHEG